MVETELKPIFGYGSAKQRNASPAAG
jgi:hypothetical protein